MLAVMIVGYPFKETIMLCGVLYFFAEVPRWKRLRYLAATVAIALAMKAAITLGIDGRVSFVTNQFVSGSQGHLFADSTLLSNIRELATPSVNHFIFVNGGTLILSLLLPMRTRIEKGTKAILGLFAVASMLAGAINEFRIILDILPISILALREYLQGPSAAAAPEGQSVAMADPNAAKISRATRPVAKFKQPLSPTRCVH